jgi:glucokinase
MGAGGSETGVVVGVDIGGSKVLAGAVAADGTVGRTARRVTPGRRVAAHLVEAALTEAVHEAAAGEPLAAVGLAAAGFIDVTRTRVLFAPHLPWRGEDVVARLSVAWGVPVVMDNDANCSAVAETAYGAARDATSMVLITLGTGIGGALMFDGRLWRGAGGMAGEFGHQQVVPGGRECQCGRSGCWEQYCSGSALLREARARLAASPVLEAACSGDPDALTGPMVTEAAAQGDAVALAAFAEVGDWLGIGLANQVAALDPALLVVGGGVSDAGNLLLDPARAALARSLVGAEDRVIPPLVRASLGPEAGLVGAGMIARELLEGPSVGG